MRRALLILLVLAATAGTFKGFLAWPDPGTADFPPRVHVSPRYLERAVVEAGRPNPVSAVLWDYRAFDLWFWIFTALAAWVTLTTLRPVELDRRGRRLIPLIRSAPWVLGLVAFLAWCMGVIPAWQGGSFLDYETLPLPGAPSGARFLAVTFLQGLVVAALAAFLITVIRKGEEPRRDRE